MGCRSNQARDEAEALEILKAEPQDAAEFAPLLRYADRLEIDAATMGDPEAVLRHGIEVSDLCCTVYYDGEPICIFGIVGDDFGSIWLLGTDLIEDHPIAFLRVSKAIVNHLRKSYSFLGNYVDARNTVHVRWLKWLGFDVRPPIPHGPFKLPFHPFSWVKTANV
jgi:hypothetical protein